ncbi:MULTISPECIES: hypothetical protein [Aquimarina]|nr:MULTISPECIES: hypothetical protein [Aquimarina]
MLKLTIEQLKNKEKQVLDKKSLFKVYGGGGIKRPIFEVPNPSPV